MNLLAVEQVILSIQLADSTVQQNKFLKDQILMLFYIC